MKTKRFLAVSVSRIVLVFSVLALLSCMLFIGGDVKAAPVAMVRAIHASPTAGPVDVFANGKKWLSNFQFGTISHYAAVPAGTYKVQVAPAGKGPAAAVISQTGTVNGNTTYTLAVIGTMARGLGLRGFIDNNTLARGMAKVRVYHLSPNAGPVNVTAGGKNLITGLTYKNASNYLTVPAGSYTFNVTATQVRATVPVHATLNANTIESIFAVGLYKGVPALRFVTGVAS